MKEILQKISLTGIVPVIKLNETDKALPLAKALCQGGIPVAEVTFRTENAEEAISIISEEVPEMLVGAGTVLTIEQADKAIMAGAKFIVSPGLNPKVVEYCIKKGVAIIPGCSNASDIEQAIELGLDVVKFFPAEAAGGIKMLKALSAPYGNIRFMPTGGIDIGNINDYLSFPKVLACGGSWMVPENFLKYGNFEGIKDLAQQALECMLGFKLAHIGINEQDQEQAESVAIQFGKLFGFGLNDATGSIFVDNMIEVMKVPNKGKHGHIAIRTNYVDRAVNYLSSKGYTFDQLTSKYDSNNNLKAIYLENEISGFAIHLVQ
jgi:2-dehydro-3-deoxyphosphogluconate aldolase/(4S)-4-hydroxy-2-oxoglutarate aldolase